MTAALASLDPAAVRAAVERFAGAGVESLPVPSLPFTTGIDATAPERVWDVLLGLGVLALLYGVGMLIRGSGRPGVRPWVFAAATLGLLMFTVVDPLFWQLKGVEADESGLTVLRYSASDQHLDWKEVRGVRVDEGSPFPVFSDDTALVLDGPEGEALRVPRLLPGSKEVARLVLDRAGAGGNSP